MDAARASVRTCVTSERVGGSDGVVVAKRRREKSVQTRNSRDGSRSDRPSRNQPFCGGVPHLTDPTDRANRPSQPTSEQRAGSRATYVLKKTFRTRNS